MFEISSISDSYDDEDVLVSDMNQHATGSQDVGHRVIQNVQFHLPGEDDVVDDQGDDGDDEDDDDQYITESDGEDDDDITSLATKFKMSPSTEVRYP